MYEPHHPYPYGYGLRASEIAPDELLDLLWYTPEKTRLPPTLAPLTGAQ